MITPKFDITQDDEFLYIKIAINNVRFSTAGVEVNINDNVLLFHLSPYYLRLRFDHNLVDDERADAKFIPGEESIMVKAPKEEKGQVFNDLDLHSKLLARMNIGADIMANSDPTVTENQIPKSKGVMIQEIDSNTVPATSSTEQDKVENIAKLGETFNWEIEQHETTDSNITGDNGLLNSTKYGFNNAYNGIIGVSLSRGNDINDLINPEATNAVDRCRERIERENMVFDDGYFASEYILYKHGDEDELSINRIKDILSFTPNLIKDYLNWTQENVGNLNNIMPITFNQMEQTQMQNNLPNKKSYLLDGETVKLNYITILSLLFSYNFELLENLGEQTSESAWNIGKLTPQIACLDQNLILSHDDLNTSSEGESVMIREVKKDEQEDVKEKEEESIIKACIVTAIKRSLCYPLHRNYELATKAWENTYYMLRGGKRLAIKALLAIHELFRYHDVYYVYNKCLLDDLCSWFISEGNETVIRSLALELHGKLEKLTKNDIQFEIVAMATAGEDPEDAPEHVTVAELEQLSEQMYLEATAEAGAA